MSRSNRRRFLTLAGSTATAAIAGCSGGGEVTETETDSPTPTLTERGPVRVEPSGGDTNLTLAFDSLAPDFETLVVDIDRAEFIGDSETDDVTVQIGDTGVDLTTLTDDKQTYLDNEPFPSGTYTRLDLYVTIQENTLSEGGSATFDYEEPISRESPGEISDDQLQNFTYTIGATREFMGETYELILAGKVAYGAP